MIHREKCVPRCNAQEGGPVFIPTWNTGKTGFLHLLMQLFVKFVRNEDCGMWGCEEQMAGYFSEFQKSPALLCF